MHVFLTIFRNLFHKFKKHEHSCKILYAILHIHCTNKLDCELDFLISQLKHMLWECQWDGSFEHLKQMFKLMDMKILTILHPKFSLTNKLHFPYPVRVVASGNLVQTQICCDILPYRLSYFSTKTYIFCAQKNRLIQTILLSTQNKCLNWWIRKY